MAALQARWLGPILTSGLSGADILVRMMEDATFDRVKPMVETPAFGGQGRRPYANLFHGAVSFSARERRNQLVSEPRRLFQSNFNRIRDRTCNI
jgi:hypothetical protein